MSTGVWAFLVAVAVMAVMAAVGIAYARRRTVTAENYISARNSTGGFVSMSTAVASVMGAWILFSPAEAATWAGLVGVIGYAVGQAAPLIAFVFLGPRMRTLMPEGHSLTEFVWFRFGRLMYGLVLVIMLLYMFTFLAAEMGAIARAVRLVTEAPLLVTLVLVAGATLAYTLYGGLRASIFTDNVQFLVIIPLLVAILAVAISQLGGWGAGFDSVRSVNPDLLDLGHQPGIEFGLSLVIAILAANLFHQGFWQRVYAAKSVSDFRRGYFWAGVIVIPMIIASGLFGLWAVGQGVVEGTGSIALFNLALAVLPGWALIALVALALVLVMSSMDTLLNAIASIFTSDLPRLRPQVQAASLLRSSRVITALLIVPAMAVGYAFDSVLYLFLIADLVCAGAVAPVFAGLFLKRLSGTGAAVSVIVGILAGALFFPLPSLAGWWTFEPLTNLWHILASGNLLGSFLVALVVSSALTAAFTIAGSRSRTAQDYDFTQLSANVHVLREQA
ncbi:MAG: hypothetical protein WD645_00325 [Dehalococcoidia bacterium]